MTAGDSLVIATVKSTIALIRAKNVDHSDKFKKIHLKRKKKKTKEAFMKSSADLVGAFFA